MKNWLFPEVVTFSATWQNSIVLINEPEPSPQIGGL
jgi:hypothetical protein